VLLLLERDELAGLEVDVKEGNDDEGSESDEGVVGGKREDGDDGAAPDVVEGKEDGMEGSGDEAAKARPVPRRASRMYDRMDVRRIAVRAADSKERTKGKERGGARREEKGRARKEDYKLGRNGRRSRSEWEARAWEVEASMEAKGRGVTALNSTSDHMDIAALFAL
jgi:hypothetical protein